MTILIELKLPYPPSVNHYWGTRATYKNKHMIPQKYLTQKAKDYAKEVQQCVFVQKGQKAYNLPIEVKVGVYVPDKRKRDLDNILKGLFDSLTKASVYADDSLIEKLEVEKLGFKKGGEVQVKIQPKEATIEQ